MDRPTRIFPYGSWKLGASSESDYIDLIVVANMTDEQFYNDLRNLLIEQREVDEVKDLRAAPVPRINIYMGRVELEALLFPFDAIPDIAEFNQLSENHVIALNSFLAAQMLLQLIPHLKVFQQSIKFLKAWARCKFFLNFQYVFLLLINPFYFLFFHFE